MRWERRAVCPDCGFHTEANALGAVPFLACCPDCGRRYSWISSHDCWPVVTMCLVALPKARWWHCTDYKWERRDGKPVLK